MIAKGVKVTIRAGEVNRRYSIRFTSGPPTAMKMTMFDVHYFDYADVDYPEGWAEELAVKWPVKSLDVQKLKRIHFPRTDHPAPWRKSSRMSLYKRGNHYEKQSGNQI
jgi:hypothetical protein